MIKYNFLTFLFIFHNIIAQRIYSDIFWQSKMKLCNKKREMLSFLPLINNSVTMGLSFLLLSISAIKSSKAINILRLLFRLYS